jgi:hypothetical protein
MYNGSHAKANNKPRIRMNKLAILFIAVVMLIGAVVGSTVAFLVTETAPVENKFTYANVTCAVAETFTPGGTTKNDVKIQNTGTTDAYIRATYVVSWLNKDGSIAPVPQGTIPNGYELSISENPDKAWTKGTDGYFYYLTPVAPGHFTEGGSLVNCSVVYPENAEYILSVEILATAVQSTPAKAVQEAWGVTPVSGN